jgi:hypothetical protein
VKEIQCGWFTEAGLIVFEVTPMLAASATWATLPASAFLGTTPNERMNLS